MKPEQELSARTNNHPRKARNATRALWIVIVASIFALMTITTRSPTHAAANNAQHVMRITQPDIKTNSDHQKHSASQSADETINCQGSYIPVRRTRSGQRRRFGRLVPSKFGGRACWSGDDLKSFVEKNDLDTSSKRLRVRTRQKPRRIVKQMINVLAVELKSGRKILFVHQRKQCRPATLSPTSEPTSNPSMSPTRSPTTGPTKSPTRPLVVVYGNINRQDGRVTNGPITLAKTKNILQNGQYTCKDIGVISSFYFKPPPRVTPTRESLVYRAQTCTNDAKQVSIVGPSFDDICFQLREPNPRGRFFGVHVFANNTVSPRVNGPRSPFQSDFKFLVTQPSDWYQRKVSLLSVSDRMVFDAMQGIGQCPDVDVGGAVFRSIFCRHSRATEIYAEKGNVVFYLSIVAGMPDRVSACAVHAKGNCRSTRRFVVPGNELPRDFGFNGARCAAQDISLVV